MGSGNLGMVTVLYFGGQFVNQVRTVAGGVRTVETKGDWVGMVGMEVVVTEEGFGCRVQETGASRGGASCVAPNCNPRLCTCTGRGLIT